VWVPEEPDVLPTLGVVVPVPVPVPVPGQFVPVPPTMELVIGANSTICACSRLCVRNPAISARSPRARLVVVAPVVAVVPGLVVRVDGCHRGLPFHGIVDVEETVAVFCTRVPFTVRWVPATWTVTVCAAGVGVSIEPTVIGVPAMTVLAGIMLP